MQPQNPGEDSASAPTGDLVALFAEAFAGRADPRLNLAGELVAGHYRLEQIVGTGGFSVVYRATHVLLERPFAIKFLPTAAAAAGDTRDRLSQFTREAQVLMQLSTRTTGIVQAHQVGVHRTQGQELLPYLVLEWLAGQTLEAWLRELRATAAPPDIRAAYDLLDGAARALAVAHSLGVAHRDLKPANLFVIDDRQHSATIKVLDFGIAKVMASQSDSAMQATRGLDGGMTPRYGAPEQFDRVHGATGPWTDVFQMALILVEILRGGVPALAGDTPNQLAVSAQNPARRPSPRTLRLDVPPAVEAVFLRALAVPVRDRYPDMTAFWTALAAALERSDAPPRPRRTARRLGAAVLGAAGLAVALASVRREPTREPPPPAPAPAAATCPDGEPAGPDGCRPACPEGQVIVDGACAPPCAADERWRDGACRRACQPLEVMLDGACRPRCDAGTVLVAGTPPGGYHPATRSAGPQVVPDLCVDRGEVTVAAFRAANPAAAQTQARTRHREPGGPQFDRYCNARHPDRGDHPINCVDLAAARAHCERAGRRLPGEWEWEWVAGRGASVYPWGPEPPSCARAVMSRPRDGCGADRTWPVGSRPAGATADGLHDLAGNLAEWTTGRLTSGRHVVRGGAWSLSDPSFFRVGHRDGVDPATRSMTLGFRCVSDAR
jgi:hypothetical protein